MRRADAVGGEYMMVGGRPRVGRAWMMFGTVTGALVVGSVLLPTAVSAEQDVVVEPSAVESPLVESSVVAPSAVASANCEGADSWIATWVIISNAGDTGSWQLNDGAFQSTADQFVVQQTYSLADQSASLSATVSFDGGAQGRPVVSSVDRPAACISAPPPTAPPTVPTTVSPATPDAVSQQLEGDLEAPAAPVPSIVSSSNCAGPDVWTSTWVVSSNAVDEGSWQLNDGALQSTATNFVIQKTYPLDEASAAWSATVSFDDGAQGVAVGSTVDRPSECVAGPPPTVSPTETVAVVYPPTAVKSPTVPAAAAPTSEPLAQSLPATGNETWILTLIGLFAVGSGLFLVGASRRSTHFS